MRLKKKKSFEILYYNALKNTFVLVDRAKTFTEAKEKFSKYYSTVISDNGANLVSIVDESGNILEKHTVL